MPAMAQWEIFHNSETGDALRQRLAELLYMPRSTVEDWVKRKNATLAPPLLLPLFLAPNSLSAQSCAACVAGAIHTMHR